MSATPESPSVECTYPDCSAYGRKWEFHHGKYCSNECEAKHQGWLALKGIRFDHTVCFTCLQPLKEIEPAKPDFEFTENGHGWTRDENGDVTLQYYSQEVTRDAATGFQYLTEFAGKGEKDRDEMVITGTICEDCGNTDHRHHDIAIADRAAIGRLESLLNADDDRSVDPHTLHRVYRETQDVDLAVGAALEE